jgi:hypothetical protein
MVLCLTFRLGDNLVGKDDERREAKRAKKREGGLVQRTRLRTETTRREGRLTRDNGWKAD